MPLWEIWWSRVWVETYLIEILCPSTLFCAYELIFTDAVDSLKGQGVPSNSPLLVSFPESWRDLHYLSKLNHGRGRDTILSICRKNWVISGTHVNIPEELANCGMSGDVRKLKSLWLKKLSCLCHSCLNGQHFQFVALL